MAIYLDSANLEEAYQAANFGWVRGVTTNPTLMARTREDPGAILAKLAELGFQQIYYQLIARDVEEMLTEARKACGIVPKGLVLKLAPTEAGFHFVARYGSQFLCCVTAVFSPMQALIAREAGARYVAVYVNRATKQMGDGIGLVGEVAQALAGSQTEILAASLKSSNEALSAVKAGAHHITLPFDLLTSLSTHPLSEQTVEQFNAQGAGIRLKT